MLFFIGVNRCPIGGSIWSLDHGVMAATLFGCVAGGVGVTGAGPGR